MTSKGYINKKKRAQLGTLNHSERRCTMLTHMKEKRKRFSFSKLYSFILKYFNI